MLVQRSSARAVTSIDLEAAVAGEAQQVGDEVDLVPVVARVVAGGGVGPAGEEEVREAVGLHAEEGERTVGPVVDEGQPVAAPDAHPGQGAGAEVETGRPHDDVELTDALRRLDAGRGDPDDGRLPEIDQGDVGTVERLEVAVHERRPLLTEPVVLRDEALGGHRVLDDGADLPGDEGAPLGIDLGVREEVQVVAGQLGEARGCSTSSRRTPGAGPRGPRRRCGRGQGGGSRAPRC